MANSKISKDCIDTALVALGNFTDEELRDYLTEVFNKARSYDDLSPNAALKKAQAEVNDATLDMLYQDVKTKADNINKIDRLTAKLKLGKINIRQFFARGNGSLAENVISKMKSAKSQLQNISWSSLTPEEFDYMRKRENGMEIAKALDDKSNSADAKKIANNVKDYINERNVQSVNSGALPLEFVNDDRMFRHIHNGSRMLSAGRSLMDAAKSLIGKYDTSIAKPLWRNYIRDLLDLEKTFQHTNAMGLDGKLDMKEVDNILDEIFDNITQGRNDIFSKSEIVNSAEVIMKKRRMFFNFKDWRSLAQYNEKYGTGDFFSMFESDIHGSSSRIGAAELLGSNPGKAYLDLKSAQQKASPATGDVTSKGALWYRNTDLYYKVAMGIDQSPVSPTLANFFGNLRAVTSMASLPLIAIKSTPDMSFIAAYGARWGMNYWDAHGQVIKGIFDRLKDEDRQHIAKLFMTSIHSEMGVTSRILDNQNTSEIMKKANMAFYRGVGLTALDSGYKTSIMTLMAKHLGVMSKVEHGGLSDALRSQLAKYDINAAEWNVLRRKTEKGLFTTDNVMNLSDSELREIYSNSDKSIPLYQLRNSLYNKVYSIFDVASESAVPSPGVFEKAWLFQGTSPGTVMGEIMRSIAQFKAFPLAYMDRVLANGFRDSVGAKAKAAWAAQMAVTTIPLSILANNLTYVAQGLSWPDPRKMSNGERFKYGLSNLTGGLGMYLNFLEPRNQNKGLLRNVISSPSLDLASDALAIPAALATGHADNAKKAFKDAANHILPIKNIPFLSPFLMGLLHEKPYLEPTQHINYGYK